jgi:hypothetical protein
MAPGSLAFVLLLVSYAVASNSSATVSASASNSSTPGPVTSSISSTSSASISTSGTATSVSTTSLTSYLATETGPLTLPISHYSFTPYPTPTLASEPPVFPATDPLCPPPVSADPVVVPNFAPAWAAAYTKATSMVCGVNVLNNSIFFNFAYRSPISLLSKKSTLLQALAGLMVSVLGTLLLLETSLACVFRSVNHNVPFDECQISWHISRIHRLEFGILTSLLHSPLVSLPHPRRS